jgi:putative methanogenesis marker protein 8
VQAIGARLTGIVRTSPIREVIEHVTSEGGTILDVTSAQIDQFEGVKRAFSSGFKRIAVSVAGFQAKAITEIKRFGKEEHVDILVFSVCNTCVCSADVKHIAEADVACASASKILRSRIGSKALLQLGMTIPVYALTEKGKRLTLSYLAEFSHKLVVFRTGKLPYDSRNKGPRLKARLK